MRKKLLRACPNYRRRTHNEALSVCFDTCHTHDAGYPIVTDFDGVLEEFDRIVGIDRIKVLHINDSKTY
ncbi:TIM barrel protein [Bacillus sp. SL00103]